MIQRFFAGEYPKKTCIHNKKAPSPRQYGQRNGARARNGNFFSRHIYYNTEPQEKQAIQQKSYIEFERFYHFQFFFIVFKQKQRKKKPPLLLQWEKAAAWVWAMRLIPR